MASQYINWLQRSFQVLPKDANWLDESGVYIFTGVVDRTWRAFYVGQADSFASRMPNHERWDEAARIGATHVHAALVSSQHERDQCEQALIKAFAPPLNTQHRPPTLGNGLASLAGKGVLPSAASTLLGTGTGLGLATTYENKLRR